MTTRRNKYFYNPIDGTPFSLALALPEGYGMYETVGEEEIKRSTVNRESQHHFIKITLLKSRAHGHDTSSPDLCSVLQCPIASKATTGESTLTGEKKKFYLALFSRLSFRVEISKNYLISSGSTVNTTTRRIITSSPPRTSSSISSTRCEDLAGSGCHSGTGHLKQVGSSEGRPCEHFLTVAFL